MPLYLGHTTARQLIDVLPVETMHYADTTSVRNSIASKSGISQLNLHLPEGVDTPYDVLISDRNEYRGWSGVRCHKCPQELPDHSFIEISQDVFLASPKLCFVLYAQHHSLAQTIVLGSQYCGTYALDKTSTTGIRERKTLTTPEELRSYARSCVRLAGAKKAQRAAELIVTHSASPMESKAALLFCLPTRLGGFGFRKPELNYQYYLGDVARSMTGKAFLRFDIFWPDFDFGLEYQGEDAHSESQRISDDIARQLAAEYHGKVLQMITKQQLVNTEQRLFLARKVGAHIGQRIPNEESFLKRNEILVQKLFIENA